MRKLTFSLFLILILTFPSRMFSQKEEAFVIENVEERWAYEAIYQAFRELNLAYPMLNKAEHKGLTGFQNYKHLVFEYRFKYGISWNAGNLKIFITEKQIKGEKGWDTNLLPMSEKQLEKQLGPVEARLRELVAGHPYEAPVAETTEEPETESEQPTTTTKGTEKTVAAAPAEAAKITVEGPAEIFLEGYGEPTSPIVLQAMSNVAAVPITCESSSEAVIIQAVKEGELGFEEEKYSFNIFAKTGAETQMVDLLFRQETTTQEFPLFLKAPNYYILPPCKEWLNKGLITQAEYDQCWLAADDCFRALDEHDIVLENDPEMLEIILQEHILSNSEITDPDLKLKSEKLNFVLKLWDENGNPYPAGEAGQFREFVKKAPCTSEWFGKNDKLTLVQLGKEGMARLRPHYDEIEKLKAGLTGDNYAATEARIKEIEAQQDAIRAEYEVKMDTIAARRNISWATTKNDTNNFYRAGELIEVYGVRWKNGKSPDILIEVPFTPVRQKKTIWYSDDFSRTFRLDVRYIAIEFTDGTDKPLQYGFTNLDKGFNEGRIQNFLKFENFIKDITGVVYYQSKSKATEIK